VSGPPSRHGRCLPAPPGSGKTSAISRLVELVRADGLVMNGLLYRVDDQHYARDGHHGVSVARALGESAIDAEVVQLGSGS
jgi:Ni2+-binding GTPase involved in maturation of urease and hydrogenase